MGKTQKQNKQGFVDFGEQPQWPKNPTWDGAFTPAYTPKEMLEMGVFEGKYISAQPLTRQIPSAWKNIPRVLKASDAPDPKINYFGVKSRQGWSDWKANGGLSVHSELGWFHWYCLYWLGRRLPQEDDWQIKRWRALCQRHQAQIDKKCRPKDYDCHRTQRQSLLQWAWDSDKAFNEANRSRARQRLAKMRGVHMGEPPKQATEDLTIVDEV